MILSEQSIFYPSSSGVAVAGATSAEVSRFITLLDTCRAANLRASSTAALISRLLSDLSWTSIRIIKGSMNVSLVFSL